MHTYSRKEIGDLDARKIADHHEERPVHHLRRSIGNLGIKQFLSNRTDGFTERDQGAGDVHVSHPRDALEVQADSLAHEVTSMEAASTNGLDKLSVTTDAQGAPVPAALRRSFESRFGRDLSGVRLHTDTKSAKAAAAMHARAFTLGRHVGFAKGEYAPETTEGRRVLAHELVHTIQQSDRQQIGIQRLAYDGQGPPIQTFPQFLARPFVPGHAFYELLAHELAYRNDLEYRYLYRAEHKYKQQALPPSDPAKPHFLDGIFARPEPLPDHYALLYSLPQVDASNALYYQIEKFEDRSLGLLIYSLLPSVSSAPRIMVFRGTDPDKVDIKADLDAKGIGSGVFARNLHTIDALLTNLEGNPGSKTVVTGHSLGGAMAQWTTAFFGNRVQELVTFNSPGISGEESDKVKTGPGGPAVSHYVTRGDIVSTAGGKHVPGTITVLEGKATKKLDALAQLGYLIYAEMTLNALPDLIDVMASDASDPSKALAAVSFIRDHPMGIETMILLGDIIGDLHGERLLRAIQVPKTSFRMWPGGQSPTDFPADAAALAERVGPISAKPAREVIDTANEAGRVSLSATLADTLPVIFDRIIPFITKIAQNPGTALMIELFTHISPLRIAALQLGFVRPVVEKIAKAGGLERILKRALD